MRGTLIAATILLAATSLSSCTTAGSALSNVAVAFTSSTPSQATTIAEATEAATLAEQAVDLYVKNGSQSAAVLTELNVLVPAIHNTLLAAQTANKSGNSAAAAAALATFNQALAAYQSYASLQGVSQ